MGLTSWPSDQPTRAALTTSLRVRDEALWLALVTWAHGAVEPQPPSLAPWAELLGVSIPSVKRWRATVPAIGALPTSNRGPRAVKGDTRAAREAARGTHPRGWPKGKPRKAPQP